MHLETAIDGGNRPPLVEAMWTVRDAQQYEVERLAGRLCSLGPYALSIVPRLARR